MIPELRRSTHPKISEIAVYNNLSEDWETLDEITVKCGMITSERNVIKKRLDDLIKHGLVLRHFDHAGCGHIQEYCAVRKIMGDTKWIFHSIEYDSTRDKFYLELCDTTYSLDINEMESIRGLIDGALHGRREIRLRELKYLFDGPGGI